MTTGRFSIPFTTVFPRRVPADIHLEKTGDFQYNNTLFVKRVPGASPDQKALLRRLIKEFPGTRHDIMRVAPAGSFGIEDYREYRKKTFSPQQAS